MVVRRAATLAVSATAVLGLLAGCGSSGGSDDAGPTERATTTTEVTTTTEAGPDLEAVGADVQDLLETADGAIDDEVAARDGFAADNDLDSAIDSTRDLRQDLYDLDADLRDLELPDDLAEELNALLTANGGYIDALDGFLEVEDIPAYNDQLDREAEARGQWYDAAAELADALEIDGVENDVDGSSSDTGDDEEASSDDETVPAGDVVSTDTLSIEVPEGFTATSSPTIQMEDENGNTIGFYDVDDDEDPEITLEDRAEAYADGAAEKNGYEVIGGPESDRIGDYDAVGWALATDDTHTEVLLFFEGEDQFGNRLHLISVESSDDDIDAVMSALEAVEDTLTVI